MSASGSTGGGVRRTRRVVAALALALAALSGCAAEPPPGAAPEAPARELQRDLDALTATGLTGAQARVVGADATSEVAASGVADLETRAPVPTDGHFRMGSTTKTLTATVALQLVGEGALGLDDTVEQWLPAVVRGNGHDGRRITLRHLLQHTSGISDVDYPMPQTVEEHFEKRFAPTPPEQIVAAALRHEPLFPPGTGWSYANTGYVLVGMLVERVTGRPWHQEVQDRIIAPLGLDATMWPGGAAGLPTPHARAYKRFGTGEPLVDVTELVNVDASGGLVTTTADLNRFLRALVTGRLLGPDELRAMQQTVPTDESVQAAFPGARYGLGIMSIPLPCGGQYWSNSGSDPGWGNDNGVTPDGRRSVVTSWSTEDVTDPVGAGAQAEAFVALTARALCRPD
jgi:D-alanyl-D-alanine carboxypeptidase